MKKYIVPSVCVSSISNETLLAGSNQSLNVSGQAVDGSAALGNRRTAHYFEEEEEMEW